MADTNTLYAGVGTTQEYQLGIDQVDLKVPSFFAFFPAEERAVIRKRFVNAIDTTNAVRVPYTGQTSADREAWLIDRITAINNRVVFIKSEVGEITKSMIAAAQMAEHDPILGAIEGAFNLVPLVGPVLSRVTIAIDQSVSAPNYERSQLAIQGNQTIIQSYITDLGELAKLRNSLYKELEAIPATPTDPTKDPNYKAPLVIPTWYYYAGAAILILLFVWYRRRNLKRSNKKGIVRGFFGKRRKR